MLDAMAKHGWYNYSLYITEDGLLIGYLETPDWKAALEGVLEEKDYVDWQNLLVKYYDYAEIKGEHLKVIDEIFHLD
jgi:L-rhamnose mutarotase